MKGKLTSFKITTTTKYMEMAILDVTGLTRAVFHRKAIDAFLAGDKKIDEDLMVKKRSDSRYISKTEKEQIYLDNERKEKLTEVASSYGVGITIVLFQAIMDYCILNANCLSQDVIDKILN